VISLSFGYTSLSFGYTWGIQPQLYQYLEACVKVFKTVVIKYI